MSKIVGISEIVLWTADLPAALRFYRDLLGLAQISPPTMPNVFLKVADGHAGIPQMIVLVPNQTPSTHSQPAINSTIWPSSCRKTSSIASMPR